MRIKRIHLECMDGTQTACGEIIDAGIYSRPIGEWINVVPVKQCRYCSETYRSWRRRDGSQPYVDSVLSRHGG